MTFLKSPDSLTHPVLDYNSIYMFRPNCRAIFKLVFEQVECTLDNAFNYEISYYKKLLK